MTGVICVLLVAASLAFQDKSKIEASFGINDREAISLAARRYLEARGTGDSALLRKVTHDRATYYQVYRQPNRPNQLSVMTEQQDLEDLDRRAKLLRGTLKEVDQKRGQRLSEEAIVIESVDIADDSAAAKVTVSNESLGINTFFLSLIKIEGQWKIVSCVAQLTQRFSSDYSHRPGGDHR